MRCHGRHSTAGSGWIRSALGVLAALLIVLPARADWFNWKPIVKPAYKPGNVWKLQDHLDAGLRRVAVLPIASAAGVKLDEDSLRMLQGALRLELARSGQFEIAEVPAEKLQSWIGRTQVSAQEQIPASLFVSLKECFAADLVLFVEVNEFTAYAPLRVGWHLKLLALDGALPLWEADELFDATNPAVTEGARRHDQNSAGKPKALRDGWNAQHSPRQFAEYSAGSLFATLPRRTAPELR